MARVFLSHSSRDNAIAAELKTWLNSRGFESVFLDIDENSGVPPGADWERELYRMIDSSQAAVLVVTPNWHDSKWCFVEFAQARALGKAIFPVIVAPGGERFIAPDIQQLDIRSDREGGLERLANELTRIALDAQGGFEWDRQRPPYPGLMNFEKEDAAVFFGRDDEVRRLIERLNARRVQGGVKLELLLGASGSGKSSLLRAGVLPRLAHDPQNWICLPPFRPRREPSAEFARAISEALGTPEDWRIWRDRITSADWDRHLEELADRLRVRCKAREAYVLVTIDQGEELFAVTPPLEMPEFLASMTLATGEHIPFVVLMALRSDYLDRLQQVIEGSRTDEILLGPFPRSRVRRIIEGPARVASLGVGEGLIAAALDDMGTDDALPLLAFTLRELHDRFGVRRGDFEFSGIELSLEHYRSLGDPVAGLNPLENAVRKRADDVLDDLALPPEALAALRQAFIGGMVRVDHDGQYVRCPASWNDLPQEAYPALEGLANARLLVIQTQDGAKTVEVAHEALLRKWPRLRAWLDAERDFLVGRAQLGYALDDWRRAVPEQKERALLRGLPLIRARQWLIDHRHVLTPEERQYIEQSVKREDIETRKSARRQKIAWASAAGFALLILVATFLFREQHNASLRADAAALTNEARSSLTRDPVAAAGFAVQAVERYPSVDAQSILLETVLALSPYLVKVLRVPNLEPSSLAWETDANTVVIGGQGKLVQWRPSVAMRANAVTETFIGPQGPPERLRSPIVALSSVGKRITVITQDGQRYAVDQSGALSGTDNLSIDSLAAAAASPDGSRIIVARDDDAEVVLFDCGDVGAAGGACRPQTIASGYAAVVAFDSEHSIAAIGFDDGTLRIVGFGDAPFQKDVPLTDPIVALAWSKGGTRLAAGTATGRVIVTDAHGLVIAEGRDAGASVSALAWNPDSLRVASACDAFSICIWQLSDGTAAGQSLQLAETLMGHNGAVTALAWTRDGSKLASAASADDDTIRIWSVDAPDRTSLLLDAGPNAVLTSIDASSDRHWLAAGDDSGNVHVWNLHSLAPQPALHAEDTAKIKLLAWSPRDPVFAVADGEGRMELRNWPDNHKPKIVGPSADDLFAMQWLPDGTNIVTGGMNDGAIAITPADGGPATTLPVRHDNSVSGLAVTSDGSRLLSVDVSGKFWLWDLPARRLLDAPRFDTGITGDRVVLSHDQRRALVAGNAGDALVYQLTENGAGPIRCRSGSNALDAAAFGADDHSVYAVSADAMLHVWSLSDRCEIVASAPIPLRTHPTDVDQPPYRNRRLIGLPELNGLAVTLGTRDIRTVATDPQTWLKRASTICYFDR